MDIVKYNTQYGSYMEANLQAYFVQMRFMSYLTEDILLPVEEEIVGNLYTRTMTAPEGVIVSGRTHKGFTKNVVLEGELSIYMLGNYYLFKAGDTFTTPPNCKKIIRVLSPTKFMNIVTVEDGIELKDIKDTITYTEEEEYKLYVDVLSNKHKKEVIWQ